MGLNIRKIDVNKWFLDVRVRKAGKERRKQISFDGTKAKAEELFIRVRTEMRHGAMAVPHRRVEYFRDVLDLYREKSPLSRKRKSQFDRIFRDLGDIPLRIFSERLEAYLKMLRVTPSPKTQKPLCNASLNRLMQMVVAALNLAEKLEAIEKNPISRARFPKFREVARDRVLSEYEVIRLRNVLASEAPHLVPLIRFALQVPCRKSELVNMRRDDLDLINSAIRVRNGTTKNDEGLWKPIPPEMLAYFRSIPPECPFLFYRLEKGVYHPLGEFKTAWKRCLRLAGIADFRFHDTRHISASALLDNGTPEQVVMQVAGWKTNMLKTYYHKAGKQALGLVRFTAGGGYLVDTPEVERAKIS